HAASLDLPSSPPRRSSDLSSAASRTVPEGLRAKGYQVREITAYRPEPVDPPAEVRAGLAAGRFGALVLTSPMIARRAAALGVHADRKSTRLNSSHVSISYA